MKVPDSLQGSQAISFLLTQGRKFRVASEPNIEVEICPYCRKDNFHLRMEVHGAGDEQTNRDGLHHCLVCGKSGNLLALKQHLGIAIAGVESRKDWSNGDVKPDTLPDVDAAHELLLSDDAAIEYLTIARGFSLDVIKQQKIGLAPKKYFQETGEVRALIYPYMVNGNTIFVHYRTLPTMPISENKIIKAFSSPKGWPVPLYNGEVLNDPSLKEVTLVEGEPNTIAALDKGYTQICGVPGANVKKVEWLDQIDKLDRIFICYDKDKVGQRAAQALATRIGIEKCWKILLPDFLVTTEDGTIRPGKDLNEWFVQGGGTIEHFDQLKADAKLFDVDGVTGSQDALSEFEDELNNKGATAKYTFPWESVNKYLRIDEADRIDVLAEEKIGKTTFVLNIMEYVVDTYGEDGVFINLDMTRAKMTRKWVSHKAQVEDNITNTPAEAEALKQAFLNGVQTVRAKTAGRKGDLYFCSPKYSSVEEIYKLMVDIIRRYGVKWIAFDNLQRLADTTKYTNRAEHMSQISKMIAQIGKDYGVQIFLILQPHRVAKGQIVGIHNIDGSSQVAKDCDGTITLHRNRIGIDTTQEFETGNYISEESATFGSDMLVTIGLSRYSGGGRTTLHYNGATSTVMEKTMGQITAMQQKANKNVGHENQLKALGIALTPAPAAAPQVEVTENVTL